MNTIMNIYLFKGNDFKFVTMFAAMDTWPSKWCLMKMTELLLPKVNPFTFNNQTSKYSFSHFQTCYFSEFSLLIQQQWIVDRVFAIHAGS